MGERIVFLKADFYLFFPFWKYVGFNCAYMYLPGVQSGGQDTALGNGMTQAQMHAIPESEWLGVKI